MSAPRRFDHDDARRRHAAGETYAALAREYGVSLGAVRLACDPRAAAANRLAHAEFQAIGTGRCAVCGGPCTRYYRRCRACLARALATSVRDGELRCVTCREWKPDAAYPHNAGGKLLRRGRHEQCATCLTAAKRTYRERQKAAGFPGRRHGTAALYSDGCRCRACLDAELARRREYRARARERRLTPA